MRAAIFFDRDGVLIKDIHLLTSIDHVHFDNNIYKALSLLIDADYLKIVITNQTVVARGLISIKEVNKINRYINNKIKINSGVFIDRFYVCPHHPHAYIEEYRIDCDCRKPKPGLLLKAALDYEIDLQKSWMIGDRISDIIAGYKAGCKTILIQTGCHERLPIISDAFDNKVKPDYIKKNMLEAIKVVLEKQKYNK